MRFRWTRPPAPKLVPIPRISPSRLVNDESCATKESWYALRREYLLPPHPSAMLGTLSHKLIQAAIGARIQSPNQKDIDLEWKRLSEEIEKELASKWPHQVIVPLVDTAHDYEVRKHRASKSAKEMWRSSEAAQHHTNERGFGNEVWVESNDKMIGGHIDFVTGKGGNVKLWDFKSGSIFQESHGTGQTDLKSEYVRQMELYSALYMESFGTWPSKYEIVQIHGRHVEVTLEKDMCRLAVADTKRALTTMNSKLIEAMSACEDSLKLASLASPSISNCKWCLYRPACSPYWTARSEALSSDWPHDIHGTVSESQLLGNGNLQLMICSISSGDEIRVYVPPAELGDCRPHTVASGKLIWVNDLKKLRGFHLYSMGATTVFYVS